MRQHPLIVKYLDFKEETDITDMRKRQFKIYGVLVMDLLPYGDLQKL